MVYHTRRTESLRGFNLVEPFWTEFRGPNTISRAAEWRADRRRALAIGSRCNQVCLYVTGVPSRQRNFTKHRRRSTDPDFLAQLEAEGFACDILFVDGDHSYAQVRADWDAYRGFVRPGGFLVFDDYGMADSSDVKRAVDGVVLSLAQEARERALVGAEASWSVWGQLANAARAKPSEMALNNEFILHRTR